jgi:hypothetical protein
LRPASCTGKGVIGLGVPRSASKRPSAMSFREETEFPCEHCLPDENNLIVYVSHDLKMPPLEEAWPVVQTLRRRRALAIAGRAHRISG